MIYQEGRMFGLQELRKFEMRVESISDFGFEISKIKVERSNMRGFVRGFPPLEEMKEVADL